MPKYILKRRDFIEVKNCAYRGKTFCFAGWETLSSWNSKEQAERAKAIAAQKGGLCEFAVWHRGKNLTKEEGTN